MQGIRRIRLLSLIEFFSVNHIFPNHPLHQSVFKALLTFY